MNDSMGEARRAGREIGNLSDQTRVRKAGSLAEGRSDQIRAV